MKHFLVLALMMAGIFGFGQNPITINGCLLNGGGANLANKTVTLRFDSMSMLPPMTVTTNANGCYSASVTPRGSQGMVTASTFNCLGVLVSSNGFFSPNSTSLTLNLSYCGTSGSCLANFTASSTNLTAAFTNTSTGINSAGTTFSWSFGDGSSSNLMSPSHTYRAPGTYTVCLAISNSSTNCNDTICKSVVIQNTTTGCVANFIKNVQGFPTGFTGNFNSTSTGVGPGTMYLWTLTSTNGPTQTFFGPNVSTPLSLGSYTMCLTIMDSMNQCNSTKCDTFVVSSGGTTTGCRASFTYAIQQSTRTVVFTSRSSTPSNNTLHSWNFGDGTFGSGLNTSHVYPRNGVFWACLTIIDSSNGAVCRSTICDSIRITGLPSTGNCRANFTYVITGNSVQFQNISMGGPGANYSWNFGDGTSSTLLNPSKTYSQSGIFRVCLTMFDSASNCRADKCDTIRLGINATTCSISGYITRDSMNLAVNNAWVRLYEIGNLGTALRQTVRSNANGYYVFNGVSNGQYLVQAMADSTTPLFRTYLPTYFGNTSWWFSSNPIQVCPSRSNTNIHLIKMASRPIRPFVVRGHIYMGTRKVNSLSGYLVYLVNSNNEVIATAETDLNGEYVISNVDAGNYSVTMDVTGLTPASVNVVLGSTSPVAAGIDFVINSTYILASVNQTQKVDLLNTQVYPNPIQNEIHVQFELVKSSLVNLTLVDVQGKLIQSYDLGKKMGSVQTVINSESLGKGMYFLKIQTDEGSNVFKLVK